MPICVIAAGKTMAFAATAFTLTWSHSVEKTEWRESWILDNNQLQIVEARVKGSGAGMDPGDGATLKDNWWIWKPQLPPVPSLNLAASGATLSPWRICFVEKDKVECQKLGELPTDNISIISCP